VECEGFFPSGYDLFWAVISYYFGKVICLTIFLRMLSRKKGFSNFWTNLLILTIKSNSYFFSTIYAMTLWILFSKPWDLDSRLWGCGTRVIDGLFFKFLEDKSRRFKNNLTLTLILWFNLRLGGYSICSVSLIAPYIKEDLKTTRGMSTSEPQYCQGSTRKTPSRRSSEEIEDAFRSTRKPAVLDNEELEGLSDPGPRDCAHGVHILG
jgi:hypothetical protein